MNRRRSHRSRWGRRRSAFLALVLASTAGCTVPNLPAPLAPETTGGDTTPLPPVVGGVISLGVDDDIRGFNPYVASQWSPAGAAVAGLVLPGAFTPGPSAEVAVPTALIRRVAVTATEPFTVTYELNQGASWSDGTPIAAEDFTYLWRQMTSNTDVVSPAGYQLISSIQSADAGKTVTVVFRTPYADWRTLFSPLLPARTLKDEPGGFATALQTGIPVAGGRYRMDAYDPVIGQTTLVRNDKYWATETTTTSVVLRAGAPADLVDALRRGDVQAVYLRPGESAATALAALDTDVRRITVPLPATTDLVFNLGADRLTADAAVRDAVAAAIRSAPLRAALGDGAAGSALATTSPFVLPAAPGAPTVAPAGVTDDPDGVADALSGAGYRRTGLYWHDPDGRVLTLVMGYDAADSTAQSAARLLQRQLGAAGIQLDLVAQTAVDVVAPLTSVSVPDIVLTLTPRTASDRGRAATLLACAAGYPQPATGTAAAETPTTTVTTAPDGEEAPPPFCDDRVRATMTGYLAGGGVDDLDALAWRRLAVLPLAEPTAVLALGPALGAVDLPPDAADLLWSGPLRTLPDWRSPG
ncbi:ABC transporter substrate-binding protein [Nakamurella deserti]|uniref:ABC transporter substrate-binding protein n=1 Tax=Nakamurella deserti TaxID=2164074 RepID=UPI000DBE0A4F|nr:ABC transporter substrate-binding protein [Nakamurella deserti]